MPGPRKGTGGRPPKPIEQKRRAGNPGKRKLPDADTVVVLPMADRGIIDRPPEHLLEAGQATWRRVWAEGITWIDETSNMDTVLLLCEAADERAMWREKVIGNRIKIETKVKVAKALRDLERSMTAWMIELGFTPAARSRLGLAEVKAQSKIEKLLADREARRANASRPAGGEPTALPSGTSPRP